MNQNSLLRSIKYKKPIQLIPIFNQIDNSSSDSIELKDSDIENLREITIMLITKDKEFSNKIGNILSSQNVTRSIDDNSMKIAISAILAITILANNYMKSKAPDIKIDGEKIEITHNYSSASDSIKYIAQIIKEAKDNEKD